MLLALLACAGTVLPNLASSIGPSSSAEAKINTAPLRLRADRGTRPGTPLYARASSTVNEVITRDVARFRAAARRELPAIQAQFPEAFYELSLVPETTFDHPNLVSVRLSRYAYTAGAHGSARFQSMTFGMVDGKARVIALGNLFQPGFDYRAELSLHLARKLSETGRASSLDEGNMSAEAALAAAQWNVGKDGLEFAFGNYDVNSYAEGTIVVTVPYRDLAGLNPASILRVALR
ncbi:MAG: DUF3298 domain-containing protein [Fimbriimonadaceae bacterium]|nr:DUF3298 domain-containing protein [Fimbriimonadaceae bacterium]